MSKKLLLKPFNWPSYSSACSISSCDRSCRNHSKAFCSLLIQKKSTFFKLKSLFIKSCTPFVHEWLQLGHLLSNQRTFQLQSLFYIVHILGLIQYSVQCNLPYFREKFPPLNSSRTFMYWDQRLQYIRPKSKKNSFRGNYMRKYGIIIF